MTISYFISVLSFKSTAFVVCILAKGGKFTFTPPPMPYHYLRTPMHNRVKIAVYENTKIIDNSQNCIELYFLESLHMKWKKPKLNCGIKAAKELV